MKFGVCFLILSIMALSTDASGAETKPQVIAAAASTRPDFSKVAIDYMPVGTARQVERLKRKRK